MMDRVTWRGTVHQLESEPEISTRIIGAGVTLWPPRSAKGWRPDAWIADARLPGTARWCEAFGENPQAALDALDAMLPAQPMAKGGTC